MDGFDQGRLRELRGGGGSRGHGTRCRFGNRILAGLMFHLA